MNLEYDSQRRLRCPEALGGCGRPCDDLEGDGNDWVCQEGCGGEWNVHDAQDELDQMEVD